MELGTQCIAELTAATALRSLDLSMIGSKIGPHLSVVTSSQQLTFLDISLVWGVMSQDLYFLSELQYWWN